MKLTMKGKGSDFASLHTDQLLYLGKDRIRSTNMWSTLTRCNCCQRIQVR